MSDHNNTGWSKHLNRVLTICLRFYFLQRPCAARQPHSPVTSQEDLHIMLGVKSHYFSVYVLKIGADAELDF